MVKDLMTANPVCVHPEEPALEARRKMADARVQCLPVVSARGKLRGLVTATDVSESSSSESTIADVMTREVLATPPGMDLQSAAALMADRGFHHLVVIQDNAVIGVMSAFDVLRAVGDGTLGPAEGDS